MLKSSVYLTDRLKGRLKGMAEASGTSEANLIRQAIEQLVDGTAPGNGPVSWVQRSRAVVFGVGVGPGDSSLLTVRALDVLRNVDRVFAPTSAPDSIGRAEMIVRDASPDVPIERLAFVMERNGSARDAAIEDAGRRLVECVERGERVAFVTLGDPNVYSTFSSVAEVVDRVRPGTPIETVPGIMAFQDLAARSGTVIVDGAESLVVVPALGDDDTTLIEALAEPGRAVIIYKGGRHLPRIAGRMAAAGRLKGAVLGELLGLPGERLQQVADVADRPASYLATVVVPPVRKARRRVRAKVARVMTATGCASPDDTGPVDGRDGGLVSFVGAGPGAPDLLTLRAADRLGRADVVVWASSLVPDAVLDHAPPTAIVHDSAGMTFDDVVGVYAAHRHDRVVRLHSGDLSIYSATQEQIDWCLATEHPFEIVPGVGSLAAASAAVGRELTVPGVAQSIISTRLPGRTSASVPANEDVAAMAAHGTTMAIYLSAARPDELQRTLLDGGAYGPDTPAVVVVRVSWPDEQVVATTVGELADAVRSTGARTVALVLVGESLPGAGLRSHLYDPTYAHGFRRRSLPGTTAGRPR